MLTRKQQELLTFIHKRLTEAGVSPSFDEMKIALGLKSKSGIHRLISALEERGFIRRLPHRARALEVLRLPQASAGHNPGDESPPTAPSPSAPGSPPRPSFTPNVITGRFPPPPIRPPADPQLANPETVHLPLYGRIAAGTPIEALRDHSTFADVPVSMLGTGDHYALEVAGDSMVDAGILDGDTVVLRRAETAENGAIVVALVDDVEVTLKRLRRKGNTIALEPANASYETRIFGSDRVKVQGLLIGLIRRY